LGDKIKTQEGINVYSERSQNIHWMKASLSLPGCFQGYQSIKLHVVKSQKSGIFGGVEVLFQPHENGIDVRDSKKKK
jgi:hypothetical protein